MVTVENIKKHLDTELDIILYDCVESTNNTVKELAVNGACEGTVVISRAQTGGKGRLGRSFFSPDGTGIYMSLLLRPFLKIEDSLAITACAAVCVADAIELCTGVGAKIKWVNDILCHGKKVCGILTEGQISKCSDTFDFAVVGIGINLFAPKDGFPDELSSIAGSILPYRTDDELICRMIAQMLNLFMKRYSRLSDKAFLHDYKKRSDLIGKKVSVVNSDISGTAIDIDDDFRLLLRLDNGNILPLSSGEVSVREIFPKNLK